MNKNSRKKRKVMVISIIGIMVFTTVMPIFGSMYSAYKEKKEIQKQIDELGLDIDVNDINFTNQPLTEDVENKEEKTK